VVAVALGTRVPRLTITHHRDLCCGLAK